MSDHPDFDDYIHDFFNTSISHHINWTFIMGNHTYNGDASPSSSHNNIRDIMMGLGITADIFTLLFNISLVLIILSNKKFRVQPFYWLILTLCSSDLLVGVFVVPFGVSYVKESAWKHGVEFCKIWSVLEMTHFSLSACTLISLCIDRLETKLSSLRPVSIYRTKLVPFVLCLFPWVFVLFVCLPVVIVGERNINLDSWIMRDVCVFVLEHEFATTAYSLMYAVPVTALCIVSITMVIFYNVKSREWNRLADNDENDAERRLNLRTSTIAALTASCVTLVFWLPLLVILFMLVTCNSRSCFPSMISYTVAYTLSMMTSPITPLLWLIHVEIRHAYKSVFINIMYKCGLCRDWYLTRNSLNSHSGAQLLDDNAEL